MRLLNIDIDDLFIAGTLKPQESRPDFYALESFLGDTHFEGIPNKVQVSTNFDDIIALTNGFLGEKYVSRVVGSTLELEAVEGEGLGTRSILFSGYAHALVGDGDYIKGVVVADAEDKIELLAYGRAPNDEGVEVIRMLLSVPSNAYYHICEEYYDCQNESWRRAQPSGVYFTTEDILKNYNI